MKTARHTKEAAEAVVKSDVLPIMTPANASNWKVCGSLRRILDYEKRTGKPAPVRTVSDIDILYISNVGRAKRPGDLFEQDGVILADAAIGQAVEAGVFDVKRNKDGAPVFGEWIKSVIHRESGIQIDFKRTLPQAWFNMLVQFTGSQRSNAAIASRAKAKGWTWTVGPRDPGFRTDTGGIVQVRSEREVFELLDLEYKDPGWRN